MSKTTKLIRNSFKIWRSSPSNRLANMLSCRRLILASIIFRTIRLIFKLDKNIITYSNLDEARPDQVNVHFNRNKQLVAGKGPWCVLCCCDLEFSKSKRLGNTELGHLFIFILNCKKMYKTWSSYYFTQDDAAWYRLYKSEPF